MKYSEAAVPYCVLLIATEALAGLRILCFLRAILSSLATSLTVCQVTLNEVMHKTITHAKVVAASCLLIALKVFKIASSLCWKLLAGHKSTTMNLVVPYHRVDSSLVHC